MRYPRWPLMLALLLLLAIGSFVAMDLQPLLYYPPARASPMAWSARCCAC